MARMPALAELDALELQRGPHWWPESGMCLMEAVAWWAGEPHNSTPACVPPLVTAWATGVNDMLPDAERQVLKVYVPRLAAIPPPRSDDDREMADLRARELFRRWG